MLGPAQRHPAATARSGERASTRLGQVWHARGTVQCAVEVDPLREERATGVLDGCLFTRRLRWHAVRAAAGLHKVGVHPEEDVRAGSRVGSAPRRGRQFQRTLPTAQFAGRTALAAGTTVDSTYS